MRKDNGKIVGFFDRQFNMGSGVGFCDVRAQVFVKLGRGFCVVLVEEAAQ